MFDRRGILHLLIARVFRAISHQRVASRRRVRMRAKRKFSAEIRSASSGAYESATHA
jgi:hypothetical protein